jgi:hypothetical protein
MAQLNRARLIEGALIHDILVRNENVLVSERPEVDCILAFYVLKLLGRDDTALFLNKAQPAIEQWFRLV